MNQNVGREIYRESFNSGYQQILQMNTSKNIELKNIK